MNNIRLINYEYFVGKRYRQLTSLERVILRQLRFDWVLKPVNQDSDAELKYVWRFGEDNVGYYFEADMPVNDAIALIKSGSINSKDVLTKLTSAFRVCDDDAEHYKIIEKYNG